MEKSLTFKMDKVLIFDIWGDVGHFRNIATTTSPLTYSFPPRTVICGIIAAILGKEKDSYYDEFSKEQCKIALKLSRPINKGKFNTNLLNTKQGSAGYTQIGYEILKNPKYRIYFYHKNKEIYEKLKEFLKEGYNAYTISLGLANCLAQFKYIGESSIKEATFKEVHSVIPLKDIKKLLEYGEYFKSKMPAEFNKDRIVTDYSEYLFNRKAGTIKAEVKGYIIEETKENIVFL